VSDDQAHAPDDLARVPDNDRTNDQRNDRIFFVFKSGNISSPMGWNAYGDGKSASKMSTFDDPYKTHYYHSKGSDRNDLTDSMEKEYLKSVENRDYSKENKSLTVTVNYDQHEPKVDLSKLNDRSNLADSTKQENLKSDKNWSCCDKNKNFTSEVENDRITKNVRN